MSWSRRGRILKQVLVVYKVTQCRVYGAEVSHPLPVPEAFHISIASTNDMGEGVFKLPYLGIVLLGVLFVDYIRKIIITLFQ